MLLALLLTASSAASSAPSAPTPVISEESSSFSSYLLPILLGFLAFVYFMSQSNSSSGQHGGAAQTTSKRVKIHEPDAERQFTAEELKKYDGHDPTSPIYLAIKGVIYDVTASEGFYGPDGAYGVFSGRDAARGLAKMDLKDQGTNISDLSPAELQTLNEWVERFNAKYQVVGKLVSK